MLAVYRWPLFFAQWKACLLCTSWDAAKAARHKARLGVRFKAARLFCALRLRRRCYEMKKRGRDAEASDYAAVFRGSPYYPNTYSFLLSPVNRELWHRQVHKYRRDVCVLLLQCFCLCHALNPFCKCPLRGLTMAFLSSLFLYDSCIVAFVSLLLISQTKAIPSSGGFGNDDQNGELLSIDKFSDKLLWLWNLDQLCSFALTWTISAKFKDLPPSRLSVLLKPLRPY